MILIFDYFSKSAHNDYAIDMIFQADAQYPQARIEYYFIQETYGVVYSTTGLCVHHIEIRDGEGNSNNGERYVSFNFSMLDNLFAAI